MAAAIASKGFGFPTGASDESAKLTPFFTNSPSGLKRSPISFPTAVTTPSPQL